MLIQNIAEGVSKQMEISLAIDVFNKISQVVLDYGKDSSARVTLTMDLVKSPVYLTPAGTISSLFRNEMRLEIFSLNKNSLSLPLSLSSISEIASKSRRVKTENYFPIRPNIWRSPIPFFKSEDVRLRPWPCW